MFESHGAVDKRVFRIEQLLANIQSDSLLSIQHPASRYLLLSFCCTCALLDTNLTLITLANVFIFAHCQTQ